MRFTPKQLFQNQTIAELGQIAESAATIYAPQGPVTGPAPLLPIQRECLALASAAPSHHNQAVMLTVTGGVRRETIDRALRMLLVHHDALRMRYKRTADEGWTQAIAPPEDRPVLTCVDLSVTSDEEATQAIESIATTMQGTLDLEVGPLVRCVYFDLGPERSARLLLLIHHLVVDAVSWQILLFDLNSACRQIEAGGDAVLAPKTTPFAEWSRRLAERANSQEARQELPAWLPEDTVCPPLPCELSEGKNVVATAATVTRQLDADTTKQLLSDAPGAYRARPHELLVTALVGVLAQFVGGETVELNMEGHGREDLFDDVDLSRTVGWFTSLYPVTLCASAK